jgi:hypothetical protein
MSCAQAFSQVRSPEMNGTTQSTNWAPDLADEAGKCHPETSSSSEPPKNKQLSILGALFGECFCGPLAAGDMKGLGQSSQFIELHGIQFIGLGAVMDELTPRERVYDTLEQLSSRTQRMISIGYLVDDEKTPGQKISESIPLDIWTQTYPDDKTMSRHVRRTIASIKVRKWS